MFGLMKLRRRKKEDPESTVDSGLADSLSQDHISLEPLVFSVANLLLNKEQIPLGDRKKNIRNTVRVDSYGEVTLELSTPKESYFGEIIVHVFFSTEMPETFLHQTKCSLNFKPSKLSKLPSFSSFTNIEAEFHSRVSKWGSYFENIPITFLKGTTGLKKGLELILPCNFCTSAVRIHLHLCTDSPNNIGGNKPFYLTSFSTFINGFNLAGSKGATGRKSTTRMLLLSKIDLQTDILEACQAEQFLPERLSFLNILDMLLSHYILRPHEFEDSFLLAIKPKEFIIQNIILAKFPSVAIKAGAILSKVIIHTEELKLKCLDSLTRLLHQLPQCSSAEAINTFYELMNQCRGANMKKAMREVINQYQETSKNIYENQLSHYTTLAAHHPDLVEDFPLNLNYVPPVTVPSNTFQAYRETAYYPSDAVSDINIDFLLGPVAIYRLVALSTVGYQAISETKLMIVYYWPIGVDYRQEPKFLGMTACQDREISFVLERQILCHGIRVVTIPVYPQFRGLGGTKKSNRLNQDRILTVLKLFGENPYQVVEAVHTHYSKMEKEKNSYTRLRQNLLKQLQTSQSSVYESNVQLLRGTRIQYLEHRESFYQLLSLSKMITVDENLPSIEEDEAPGLPHWALVSKKLSEAIYQFKQPISLIQDQLTLKTIFRHITGVFVSSVRLQAARALTSLIRNSNTWNTWVVDIFLEYFATRNSTRAFKTVPKKIVLNMLQEMIPFSESTTAAGQIFALMEATMSETPMDYDLVGWLLLVVSDNEIFQQKKDPHGAHIGSVCAGCDMRPIYGMRFRCAYCIDYDLCQTCEQKSASIHNPSHEFVVIKAPLPPYPHKIQSGSDFHVSAILRQSLDENTDSDNELKDLAVNEQPRTLIHQFTVCYECGIAPIIGARYKCLYCPNFDYCERCFLTQEHIEYHMFLKKKKAKVRAQILSDDDYCLSLLLHPSFYPRSVRIGTVGTSIRSDNVAMKHLVKRNARKSGSYIGRLKASVSYIFPDNIAWDQERDHAQSIPDYHESPLLTLLKLLGYCILNPNFSYVFQLGAELLEKLTQQTSIDVVAEEILPNSQFQEILKNLYHTDPFSQVAFLKFLDSILQKDFYKAKSTSDHTKSFDNIKQYLISHTELFLSDIHPPNEVELALDILSLCLRSQEQRWKNMDESPSGSKMRLSPNLRRTSAPKRNSLPRPLSPLVMAHTKNKDLSSSSGPISYEPPGMASNASPANGKGIPVTRTKAFSQHPTVSASKILGLLTPSETPSVQPPSSSHVVKTKEKRLSIQEKESGLILDALEQMTERKRNKPIQESIVNLLLQLLELYPLRSSTVQVWNRILHLLSRGDPQYLGNSLKLRKHFDQLMEASKLHKNYGILGDSLRKLFESILSADIDSEIYFIYVSEAARQVINIGNEKSFFLDILLEVLFEQCNARLSTPPKGIMESVMGSLAHYIQNSRTPSDAMIDKVLDLLFDMTNTCKSVSSVVIQSDPIVWHIFLDFLDRDETPLAVFMEKQCNHNRTNKLSLFVHTLLQRGPETVSFFLELINERLRGSPGNETIACCVELLSNESVAREFIERYAGHEFLLNVLVGERNQIGNRDDLTELLLSALQPGPIPILTNATSQVENINSLAKVVVCSSDSLLTKTSVSDFKEPYLLTCKFPHSVLLNTVCVTIFSEIHQQPPESMTISLYTSQLSFVEYNHTFSFNQQSSNVFRFDIPGNRPCFYVSLVIKPAGGSMQLCNITFLGQTLKTKQQLANSKNISFSFATLLTEKLLLFDSIRELISNCFAREPFLPKLLDLCSPLHENLQTFLFLMARSNLTIANAITHHVLQLPNKTTIHANLVELLVTMINEQQEQRLILLRDFVFDQLNQFDVIPFIDALCAALSHQHVPIEQKQLGQLLVQVKHASANSAIYNHAMTLLCIILTFQPEFFKEILELSPLLQSRSQFSDTGALAMHGNDLSMICQITNASTKCADALLESELLEDIFLEFQDILKDSALNTNSSRRRSSIGVFLTSGGSEHDRISARRSLTSFLSPRERTTPALALANSNSERYSGESKIPKHFLALSSFFLDISHSSSLKEWGGNNLIPLCLRLIPDKTVKLRQRLLEIIAAFCNGSDNNQKLVSGNCFKLLQILKRKDIIESQWQLYLHSLVQMKDLLAIKNEVSCCLIERCQVTQRTKPSSTQGATSNIEFMSKMVNSASGDTFRMEQGIIATKSTPSLCTIIHPEAINLPFSIDLEITETNDVLASNNLFIGFIGNRKGHSFDKVYSTYANRAIGNTGYSISFSGEYIFQLGNSYYSQTSRSSFSAGDIIQANIDTKGVVTFKYNGAVINCDYVPSFSLPIDANSRFYFGVSVYNFTAKFDLRPLSPGTVLLRRAQTQVEIDRKLTEDISALRFLRVKTMYRLPSTRQLYELIPKILDSHSHRNNMKVTFNMTDTPDEPLPLSTSLLEVQSLSSSLHEEIIDLEYTCMARDASDEHDTLYNEIQQAKKVVLPTTCYPILKLFADGNGLSSLVTLLKKTCKQLFDPSITQTLYILRWVYQLTSHLKIPGYTEMFITNNECVEVFLQVLQWIVRCVYVLNAETNQIQDKNTLRDFKYSESQLISPLEESLIQLFRLPARRSQLTAIRTSVIDTNLLHNILAYMGHLESTTARKPELFDDELKGEVGQVRGASGKSKLKSSKSSKRYWARGTGFGTYKDKQEEWRPQKFAKQQLRKSKLLAKVFDLLTAYITIPEVSQSKSQSTKGIIPLNLFDVFQSSALVPIIEAYLRNDSIIDILKFIELYQAIFSFLRAVCAHSSLVPLVLLLENQNISLLELVERTNTNALNMTTRVTQNLTKEDALQQTFAEDVSQTLKQMKRAEKKRVRRLSLTLSDSSGTMNGKKKEKKIRKKVKESDRLQAEYQSQLEDYRYGESKGIGNERTFKYHDKISLANVSKETTHRLITELSSMSSNLPLHWNSSVFLSVDPTNISVMQALITGPAKTPYANGCFLFDVYCGPRYPQGPPLVNLQTTGYGRVRFNPNLYKCGKVCLSLLGTWKGAQNEQWNSETSTLLQVFVSIQALIFVEHPYFNEPSYERWIGTPMGWVSSRAYNENIKPETVRYGMVDMLRKPPRGFEQVIKTHFTLKKKEILSQMTKWEREQVHKKNSLRLAVRELKEELAKLPDP